eukprot:2026463-Amphidinium_carterae.1
MVRQFGTHFVTKQHPGILCLIHLLGSCSRGKVQRDSGREEARRRCSYILCGSVPNYSEHNLSLDPTSLGKRM